MIIRFVQSSDNYIQCPQTNYPEFAFIGRSNVGKSSLINMLVGVKNAAKTSSTPGKTRRINHFEVFYNDNLKEIKSKHKEYRWYLTDLPGYGYAKVSKKELVHLEQMIFDYILNRSNLMVLFVLIDCRLEPQAIDLAFINYLGENRVPFVIVLTKIDKISSTQLQKNTSIFMEELLKTWEYLPQLFYTSAVTKRGRFDLLNFILSTIDNYWNKNK